MRASGYQTLVTHVVDRASEYLDSDAVFAVISSLLLAPSPLPETGT